MTKRKMCVAGLVASGMLIALSAGCKDNPVPPPPKDPIELLYPAGGESLMVDSTVVIRWLINDSTKVSSGSVAVELSLNNGMTFPIMIVNHSLPLDTTFASWTVSNSQTSAQCIIRVRDYSDYSVIDKSGVFTVHN
jgi:hypothetical protein